MQQRRVNHWVSMVVLIGLWGCGPAEEKLPSLVPVNGTVTYDGKPLEGATVFFAPTDGKGGFAASGFTDSAGKYSLETSTGNGRSNPGAVPGKYGVKISRMVKPDGSVWKPDPKNDSGPMTMGAREELPPEYSMQPNFTADVSSDKPTHDFKLDKKEKFNPVMKPAKKN